ncbi:glycosyltransferase family 2 protein [Patescibacteria group bacterium]
MLNLKVFVVILNYNGKDVIERCLTSVLNSDYPNLEIVVVDNNSTDGSLEFIKRKFSKVHFIKNSRNIGFSAGNNVGIRFAIERMADYVFILNNDAWVEKNSITKLVEFTEKNQEISISNPLIMKNKREVWFEGGRIDWMKMKAYHLKNSQKTDYLTGCAMLIGKDVFKKIGLFDEDYFLYYEDVDFSVRAVRSGFGIGINRNSIIFHNESSETENPNKVYWLVLSALIFFKKHTPLRLRWWISVYSYLRRMKNRKDLKKGINKNVAIKVKKAYTDFGKIK